MLVTKKENNHSEAEKSDQNPRERLQDLLPLRGISDEFAPRLRGFLIRRLGSRENAQDLAQEAYLRLLRVDKDKVIEKPESYLFRIAANLANEYSMHQRRTPAMVELETLDTSSEGGDGDAFERNLEHRAAIRQLENILDGMPPLYSAVLLLRKRDGLSREEIAKELDVSVHTVKKYLARAVAHCREKWTWGKP